MNKPKILPPSLREKKRYLVCKIIADDKITYDEFTSSARKVFLDFMGEHEYSIARIWIIKNLFDEAGGDFIVQCNHAYTEKVRLGLSLIRLVGETKTIVSTTSITGTIKSARGKIQGV